MHIRVESPYVSPDGTLTAFRAFTGEKAKQMHRLNQEASAVPRTLLHKLVPLRQGKYLFVAFDTESDLPVALSTCVIIETGGLNYGVITDFVVLAEYRRKGVAHQLVLDIVRRMSDPNVLMASRNTQLAMLHVAISSHVISCRKLFEGCGFVLAQRIGQKGGQKVIENIYELRLPKTED